jgi:hypothetical protein
MHEFRILGYLLSIEGRNRLTELESADECQR